MGEEMNDAIVEQLAVQVAELRNKVESLEAAMEESGGDSMDDLFLHIKEAGSGGTEQGAFRFEGNKITHCNFYAAHAVVELADVTVGQGEADGTWYLNVTHNNPRSATVSKTAGPNDDDHTAVKLFTISNGEVVKDYRGMPFIPIYA